MFTCLKMFCMGVFYHEKILQWIGTVRYSDISHSWFSYHMMCYVPNIKNRKNKDMNNKFSTHRYCWRISSPENWNLGVETKKRYSRKEREAYSRHRHWMGQKGDMRAFFMPIPHPKILHNLLAVKSQEELFSWNICTIPHDIVIVWWTIIPDHCYVSFYTAS